MTFHAPIKAKTGLDLPSLYLPPLSSIPEDKRLQPTNLCSIYARYSTLDQKEDSIERQVENCQAYIEKHGLRLVGVYADRGVSGTTDERDELERLREDGKKGRFSHVITENLDRVARKLSIAVNIFEELAAHNIVLHDVFSNRAATIEDIAQKGVSAQLARDYLVKRNQQGIRKSAAKGTFGIGACFGYEQVYDAEKREIVWSVNKKQAKLVLAAFRLCAKGVSPGRIADLFNKRPEEKRGKKKWTYTYLAGSAALGTGLLRNVRYVGIRLHGRNSFATTIDKNGVERTKLQVNPLSQWVIGDLDPSLQIVPKELFDKVQEVLKQRSDAAAGMHPKIPRYTSEHAPLKGLMRCAHCGGGMTPYQKGGLRKPAVSCNKARNNDGCSNGSSFSLYHVEDEIHRVLAENLSLEQSWEPYITEYNLARGDHLEDIGEETLIAERARTRILDEFDRIRRDELEQRFPHDYLEKARKKANAEYDKIRDRLAELDAKSRNASKKVDFRKLMDAQQRLLESIAGVFQSDFDATSETGTEVIAQLRELVHSVVLDIDGEGCNLVLKCRIASGDNSEANLVTFSSRLVRNSGAWAASVREVRRVDKVVERGDRSLTDDEWERVKHLVSDSVALSKRGGDPVDKRNIVDAALLHLSEGVPLNNMPARFGKRDAVLKGLKRLSSSGSWDAVADALHLISPDRIPNVKSEMFATDRSKASSALKGVPLIRATHGIAAAAGEHAPTDAVWRQIKKLIPEQVLQVYKEPAVISPRTFLHGLLFWLNKNIPMAHLPLMFGSERFFNGAVSRLANHGKLDELLDVLLKISPSPLKGADLSKLERFPRAANERTVWRRALPKRSDMDGIPEHFPDDATWDLVQHLFPAELLFVNDAPAIISPQRLGHAILYRIREKIPFAAMPTYFGDPEMVKLVVTKWVFHHLWDEFQRILTERKPEVLVDADTGVFKRYKRGRLQRYHHLINSERLPVPPHEPTSDDFAFVADLIPEEILCLRGGPAIMTPRKFFHAIVFMLKERVLFGGLNAYFGDNYDVRVVTRKFVNHHYWDTMRARIEFGEPEWAGDADLSLFDSLARSKNFNPEFRRRPSSGRKPKRH